MFLFVAIHVCTFRYDGYDIQHCLKYCVENGACDGAAFLTERCGDIVGALKLLTEGMSSHLDSIRSFYDKHLGATFVYNSMLLRYSSLSDRCLGSVELDANSSRVEKQLLARLLQVVIPLSGTFVLHTYSPYSYCVVPCLSALGSTRLPMKTA
jgi:hypothetical protein